MDRHLLYDKLIDWLLSFDFVENVSIHDLLSGQIISDILHEIESDTFTNEWKSRLNFDPDLNWRLKASNLKKIMNSMTDYLKSCANVALDNFQFPDVNKMCEFSDIIEMSSLIQLLLLCAVNCRKKEMYIQKIMSLESTVQLVIMEAIQELLDNESSMESLVSSDDKTENSASIVESLQREKESLKQKCHELELKLRMVNEEKLVLESELKVTKKHSFGNDSKTSKFLSDSSLDSENSSPESMRIRQLQEKVYSLQSELYKLEHNKDDDRQKQIMLEGENAELREQIEKLIVETNEQQHIKDELDITKERLKTLSGIEATLEKYKKHVDDSGELVRQNRQLELENSNFLDRIFKLEEEAKKSVSLKSQIEMYKNEISNVQSQYSQQEKDLNKYDFDLKLALDKIKILEQEKSLLQDEVKKIQEENEDLHVTSYTIGSESSSEPSSEAQELNNVYYDVIDIMQIPPHMRESVIRLQKEVKVLRKNVGTDSEQKSTDNLGNQNREQLLVSLETSQARIKQLSFENKQLHQEVLTLTSNTDDKFQNQRNNTIKSVPVLETKTHEEVEQIENKYKGYLEKAKYVIYHLHQKLLQYEQSKIGSQDFETPPTPTGEHDASFAMENKENITRSDYEALKKAFIEKERQLDELQKQYERAQSLREEEEKMVVAAWYNLGVRLNREAAQERLRHDSDNSSNSIKSSEPNSFLSKQRIAHLMTSNRGSKDDSSEKH